MELLLDTHAFLWFIGNDPRLGIEAAKLIREPSNAVYLSVASSWEICIKVSIGKLTLAASAAEFLPDQIARNNIRVLPIDIRHTLLVAELPLHHRDPFDRLLVAQCLVENIPVLSGDSVLDSYGVTRIW